MEGETISIKHSSQSKPFNTVSILVVDDDTTCLTIVAAILRKFQYEVVTVKNPKDALCTLRIKNGAFDLVVSDVHMPDMNGYELQQAISQEFNLPVVLMSADDKEGVAVKGLESGASFFIMKPISPNDLKDIGKFAMKKKTHAAVIEEAEGKNCSDEDRQNKKDTKRKSSRKEASDDQSGETLESASQKKAKVIWNTALHNKFLEAIRKIGLDRAVPKKILEEMNIPGLTRENVASHLQKYRIFLRRVSDTSYKIQCAPDQSRSLRSLLTSSSGGDTSPSILIKTPNNFPYEEASSAFGQSRLLSNKGSWLIKPNNPVASPTRQSDRAFINITHNNTYQTNTMKDLPSSLSSSFDASILDFWSGISSNITSSMPSRNITLQTNYVGYEISNLQHLAKSEQGKKNNQLGSATPNDCIDLDQLLQELEDTSSSYYSDINVGAKQLSDVIADFQMLLPPDTSLLENGGEIGQSSFSPMFDLSEFDIMPVQQPPDEDDDINSPASAGQANITTQAQQNGGEVVSRPGFYGVTSPWDNNFVPSFDQATIQHEDDAFLESLLAPDLFGEDKTLEESNNNDII